MSSCKEMCPICGNNDAEITCSHCHQDVCPSCTFEGVYDDVCGDCITADKELNGET